MRTTQRRYSLLLRAVCKATAAVFILLPGPFPVSALPQASRSGDEEAVRALTERFGQAVAAGDLETMRQLWNPQSPNLASRLRVYQRLFSETRIEFTRMKVTPLEVTGDKAVSQLTTDERQLDKKTGLLVTERDLFHGSRRSLEWTKTASGWKIERESLLQDELAARLEEAVSEDQRRELLEKENALVTDVLVRSLTQRGDRYRIRGESDASLRCLQLAQAVAEKIGDELGIARVWVILGMLRVVQNDYEEALPFGQRALAIYEAAGNRLGVAVALSVLSHTYHMLGDFRHAFESASKSLRLAEELNNQRRIADALSELAHVYDFQNNYQQALAYFERELLIYKELGDTLQIAILQFGITDYREKLGHYDLALENHRDLLKQTEGFGDQAGAAIIRLSIAKIHAARGRYGEARDYYRQSLQAFEAANSKQAVVATLVPMSDSYLAEGKYSEALPLAERAVTLSRQNGWQLDLWLALTSLGYCQLGLNRPIEARQAFAEAVSIFETLRGQTAGGDEERQRYFEGGLRAHHGRLGLLVKESTPQEALAFAERTKARVLLDVLQQGRVSIQKAMTLEEREQERRLKSELTRLNTQLARATQSDQPDRLRLNELTPRVGKARLNYEAFQSSLYAAHPELKVHRGEASIIKAEELTALLSDTNSAVLEYVVTAEATYLFAVTKAKGQPATDVQLFTIPIKRAQLVQQTESFRQQLAGRDLGFRTSAHQLYDLLLKPAQALLRGKPGLVIVPDDKLWELPFQALLADDQRFLIESSAISYAPSLTVLREMQRNRRSSEAATSILLALGNPAIGQETIELAETVLRDGKLSPLPEAEQEVRALGRIYGSPRSKVYIGAEAREDRVKTEAGQARILHFATHGTLNNAAPMYSHLVLAQGNKNDDGLLEAWELMALDLKADLAVLSACETARGRFGAGEGMIGLTWALFVAGVPTTVVSQWKVESASTRDLMVSFHGGLISPPRVGKAKATKTEALRQAALKLLKSPETSHPFYWAGFVLVGDGR
ncbi:MAG: CHAT domain-containing protein [Pyrinomonadaceae bacterium]|nr:CHAT domain-containing protein [Pyrinomonadaceae bacterium]